MYCNEDLERFYFKYQSEALPHGQSLQSFCLNNHVPYNLFSKWYKDTRRKIVTVQVDDRPLDLCRKNFLQIYNAVSCVVRSLTTARIKSFYWECALGAQMSATYHSIISTVKLHGSSVWSYLGKFFTKIFEGCRDYSSLTLLYRTSIVLNVKNQFKF